jgi:hypothetical protein
MSKCQLSNKRCLTVEVVKAIATAAEAVALNNN